MTLQVFKHLRWAGLFLILSGCSTSYRIQVIDGLPREIYLTYSKGTDVKVGDIFALYEVHRPQSSGSMEGHGGHGGHGSQGGESQPIMKHERATVLVVRIVDEVHAAVRVLSGEAAEGLEVEKLR